MTKHAKIIESKDDDLSGNSAEGDLTVIEVQSEEEKNVPELTGVECRPDTREAVERQKKRTPSGGDSAASRTRLVPHWDLPKLAPWPLKRRGRERGNGRGLWKEIRGERRPKSLLGPVNAPLVNSEENFEVQRSVHGRKFVSLHEELNHLRTGYLHAKRTLCLRSEEVERLRAEVMEKSNLVEHMKALLAMMQKKLLGTNDCSAANDNIVGSDDTGLNLPPAFFAVAKGDGVRCNHGATANLLMDLRQNIAMRDTVINDLRAEITSLRNAKSAVDDRVQTLEAELAESRARCDSLIADADIRSSTIENMPRYCFTTQIGYSNSPNRGVGRGSGDGGGNGGADVDVRTTPFQLVEHRERYHTVDNAMSDVGRHMERTAAAQVCSPCVARGEISLLPQEGLRVELMHTRQTLEREREATAELERQWRRRREADLAMMEAELNTAKTEVEAYKQEMTRIQRRLTTASFAEVQLQAAHNENDVLQQRVVELREANTAQTSRERELRSELNITKEACNRHESEVASLQSRLKASRASECGLREEVEILGEKLARAEERLRTMKSGSTVSSLKDGMTLSPNASPPHDLSSYAALMKLNANLQDQLSALETELQRAKGTSPPRVPPLLEKRGTTWMGNADEVASNDATWARRFAQFSTETVALKLDIEAIQTFLHKLQKRFASSKGLSSGLRAELEGVCNTCDVLFRRWEKVAQDVTQMGESEAPAVEADKMTLEKKQRSSAIRDRLQSVQRHALLTAEAPDFLTALETQTNRLKEREEELKRTRLQLTAAMEEIDALRQKQKQPRSAGEEESVCGVGERKGSSQFATRTVLTQLREQLALRDATVEELKTKTVEQQRVIESLRNATSPVSTASPISNRGRWDDEKIIEEALRQEAIRMDEEMDEMRCKVHAMQKERDYWRAMAMGAPRAASR